MGTVLLLLFNLYFRTSEDEAELRLSVALKVGLVSTSQLVSQGSYSLKIICVLEATVKMQN